MIKVKDGYAKLIGTTYQGSATQVLLSNGGDLEYSASSKASTLVQRNASQHIYATYFNSAISDEALTDIGSVYVRNTSDTFIRRVSKTQFYSILDNKFVTLDTTQSITGAKTFSTSVRFVSNASIIQNQNDTSNYTTILKWYKNGASRNTYDPSIGQHNTGGDGNGSICILPYPTATSPWGGTVGLFISKGVLKLDGKSVALAENYYTKTESDERYVNVTGDTMTGPLIVKAAITGTQLISTIATGTSPFTVSSTTVVSNLNADMLDGWHLSYILKDGYVTSGTAGLSSYWRKVWDITLNNQDNDVDINLLVHSAYNQQWGIISFKLKQNGTGTAKNISAYLAEVVGNIPTDRFRLYYNNSSGLCQLWCNPSSQYSVYNYRVLAKTWRIGTEATTLGTFYTGNTTTAQSLPSDSYVSMTGITIVNTAAKVANTLTFAAGAFAIKTYNGSAAVTVNIPTHTSHLTNNSGFWTGTRYWANIAVSTASSTSTQPTFNTCYTSNWFRSTGSTGWYSQTYGGGWYMTDSTWIRTYGSKSVYQNTGQIRTDGYLVTNGGITVGATSPNNGTYKSHVTGNSWSSGYIRAGAGFYHNSVNSNSYVLLAGGSYKSLADFAKGNAGSATKGVYVTGGTVTAMTYSLNANLNSGTAGKLAYYSSATTVASYGSTVGASNRGIYMNAGVPMAVTHYLNSTVNSGTSGKLAYYSNATTIASYGSTIGNTARPVYINAGVPVMSQYSFTGTYSNPVVIWCGEIYRSSASSQYWYITKIGGCCSASLYDNYANDGNLVVSLSDGTPYAAICNTIRFWDGGTARSAGDGTIGGQSAGMGDYMTICTSDRKIYIRKFSQQNKNNDSWTNGELGTTITSNGNKPVARFSLVVIGVHN